MRTNLLTFCLGVLALRWLPFYLDGWFLWGTVLLALLMLCHAGLRSVAVFVFALCWASWHAGLIIEDRLDPEWNAQTLWVEGRIAELPQWSSSSTDQPVVRFELLNAQSRHTDLPKRIRLSWYQPQTLKAGERWRLAVKLKQPHGQLNPHVFDYQQWLTARRVGATGHVKQGQKLAEGRGLPAWREQLRDQIQALLPQPDSAAVLALVLGDGSSLSQAQWRVLQASGIVHLFVISGQHISLVAGLTYGLVVLLVRFGLWPMRIPWLPVACCLAFFTALLYGALAGFGVPVRRALIMVAVVLFWRMRYQQLASWTPWLWALTLVLALDPMVILQSGFWLSFAAVGVLLLVFSGRLRPWRWWQLMGRVQWAAALGLFPFLMALGLPVSWVGPAVNMVAVPLVSFWLLPLALFGLLLIPQPILAEPVLALAAMSLRWFWAGLEYVTAEIPAWQAAPRPFWVIGLTMFAVLLLLLPRALRPLWLTLCLLFPLLWPPLPPAIAMGRARVWLLDVGQGQAIVVQTSEHVLLYDAGPAIGNMNAGEQILVPFLRGERIQKIDTLLLSHADADHAGGAQAIMAHFMVEQVVSGEPQRHTHWNVQPCDERYWQWDGVEFWQWQWQQAEQGNQASCVLLVNAGGERFLVTGDLDTDGEQALLQDWPWLKAHWLVAGHHGSRTSTGAALLRQIQPHAVLISRGRYNHYGHPHPDVLDRIERAGIQLYDTAVHKAVLIRLGNGQQPWFMAQEKRFWRKNET